jgi:hypothetical protein
MLNRALQATAGLRLLSIRVSELSTVVADVSAGDSGARAQVLLSVDRRILISWLRTSPAIAVPAPATWAGVDAALQFAAPRVRLLVADVTGGSCQPVHGLDPGTPAPLGAAVKLYVLDALGHAVAADTVRWNQPWSAAGNTARSALARDRRGSWKPSTGRSDAFRISNLAAGRTLLTNGSAVTSAGLKVPRGKLAVIWTWRPRLT